MADADEAAVSRSEREREHAGLQIDRIKYVAAGNFVTLAICVVIFRFYGDELTVGKGFIAASVLLTLWSIVVYASATIQLRYWVEHSFAAEHLPRTLTTGFVCSDPEPTDPWYRFLFGFLYYHGNQIEDFATAVDNIRSAYDRGLELQFLASIAFITGLVFFATANF